ncbi:threonine synthase [Azospirillum picis]|uniref:Threonine synthase n=1 Tax=Azospirillum picis TaxID=488438 RepID=A0ABU0MER6_9PROT|nr:threonine synthase [Azospirillum picis]MBP2298083.1 threonine synthase [Azospirillum picis]MDQ0531921.1 threonine synthase [Azospirillum picis]
MRYVSTRGVAPVLGFEDVLLAGLARDGGLYVPETWPQFTADDIRALRGLPYSEIAVRVMLPFLGGAIAEDEFRAIVRDAYAGFDHAAVTPLVQIDPTTWVLELFHGPTLAFKDVALQLLGRLFDHVLAKRGQRVTIVGATSGDTGSAAIEACRDRRNVDIFILHPKGRTSEVQRRQMTSVLSSNVHNIAVDGTFDDCQDLVKAMFNDGAFRDRMGLSAVNSINWARIMAQIVYYFTAAVALGAPDRKVAFTVPTGNFGNVYAAYGARAMGLPVETLVVGSNSNDILARFFASGAMAAAPVVPTLSPSMDIQISSNFERLLFDLLDRDGAAVTAALNRFRAEGRFEVTEAQLARALAIFSGHRVDEAGTMATIADTWTGSLYLLDPHTAVGIAAAKAAVAAGRVERTAPMVVLATAHPAKFPDAVEKATGRRPDLPPRLSDLYVREERLSELPNDLAAVQDFVTARARAAQEAA